MDDYKWSLVYKFITKNQGMSLVILSIIVLVGYPLSVQLYAKVRRRRRPPVSSHLKFVTWDKGIAVLLVCAGLVFMAMGR